MGKSSTYLVIEVVYVKCKRMGAVFLFCKATITKYYKVGSLCTCPVSLEAGKSKVKSLAHQCLMAVLFPGSSCIPAVSY